MKKNTYENIDAAYKLEKPSVSDLLTKRELECLVFLSEGLNSKEVARNMYISDETVISHTRSIRRKLNSRNITQAVTKAYNKGLLRLKDN